MSWLDFLSSIDCPSAFCTRFGVSTAKKTITLHKKYESIRKIFSPWKRNARFGGAMPLDLLRQAPGLVR